MTSRRRAALILTAVLGTSLLANGAAQASGRTFGDCAAMHAVYPNGVARSSSVKASPFWIPIRTPAVNATVYAANKKLDRDNDGIACEVAR